MIPCVNYFLSPIIIFSGMEGYITAIIAGYPVEDMHNKQIDVSRHGGRSGQTYFRN
jgi:hypothetical protein